MYKTIFTSVHILVTRVLYKLRVCNYFGNRNGQQQGIFSYIKSIWRWKISCSIIVFAGVSFHLFSKFIHSANGQTRSYQVVPILIFKPQFNPSFMQNNIVKFLLVCSIGGSQPGPVPDHVYITKGLSASLPCPLSRIASP